MGLLATMAWHDYHKVMIQGDSTTKPTSATISAAWDTDTNVDPLTTHLSLIARGCESHLKGLSLQSSCINCVQMCVPPFSTSASDVLVNLLQ